MYDSVALVAFALSMVCVPLARRLGLAFDVTDKPGPGHPHSHVTAKLGGVGIIAGFVGSLILAGSLSVQTGLCTGAMLAIGIADDVWVLTPGKKLVLQLVVAAIFVFSAVHLRWELWPWAVALLTVVWLTATTNAYNLIDGLDGLACGIGIIACGAIFAISIFEGNRERAVQAAALGAALVGFLPYNLHPATVFMGDSGSLPIGFLLGVLSFRVDRPGTSSSIVPFVLAFFVMLVPLLDAGTVAIARISTGRRVSARGLDHLHHRLLALGLSQRGAVLLCWSLGLLSALYAVTVSVMSHAYVVLSLPMVCLASAPLALFLIDLAFEADSPGTAYSSAHGVARVFLSLGYRLRLIEVLLDMFLATASYFVVFLLCSNFRVSDQMIQSLLKGLPWVLSAICVAFYANRVYLGVWHYVGLTDVVRMGNASVLAVLLMFALSLLNLVPYKPAAVVFFGIVLFDFLVATRVSLRLIRRAITALTDTEWRVLLVGTHPRWEDIVSECSRVTGRRAKAVGFVDDDLFLQGMRIGGIRVLGPIDALPEIHNSLGFDELVITNGLEQDRLLIVLRFAHQHRLRLSNYTVHLEQLIGDTRFDTGAESTSMKLATANLQR